MAQREDARFIFDARTIQRMELLILSTLQWGMCSIMPFSFIDYLAYRAVHGLGRDAPPKALISRAMELILSTSVSEMPGVTPPLTRSSGLGPYGVL